MVSRATPGETPLTADEEIEALLAWYAAGTLSVADRTRVDSYLAAHPEAVAHVLLAREEREGVIAANDAIKLATDGLKLAPAILARVRSPQAVKPVSRFARALDWAGDFLSGLEPRQLAMAGLAAGVLLVAQTSLMGVLMAGRGAGGSTYGTASGPALAGTYAMVGFAPDATAARIGLLLREDGLSIIDGPRADGLYRVRLSTAKLSDAEAGQALARLTSRTSVVSFAALSR